MWCGQFCLLVWVLRNLSDRSHMTLSSIDLDVNRYVQCSQFGFRGVCYAYALLLMSIDTGGYG